LAKIEMVIDEFREEVEIVERKVKLKEKDGNRSLWMGMGVTSHVDSYKGHGRAMVEVKSFAYSVINNLGAVLKHVIIDKLIEDRYGAKAVLEVGERTVEIECRAIDATAAALNAKAPIFVNEEILTKPEEEKGKR